MLSQPRLDAIIQLLKTSPRTGQELASRFQVTVRTIRSDIQALNRLMTGGGIVQKRGQGYQLEIQDERAFAAWQRHLHSEQKGLSLESPEDRQKYLLSLLLMNEEWQDPEDLAESIYVSRNTIQGYLRSIRTLCSRYSLTFESRGQQGIRITGPEAKRRECLSSQVLERNLQEYVTGFSGLEASLFDHTDLEQLSAGIYEILESLDLSCSDYALKNLVLHAALMTERVRHGGIIEELAPDGVVPEARAAADGICDRIFREEGLPFPAGERDSLALHIALNTRQRGLMDNEELKSQIDQMLTHIWNAWRFDLRQDQVLRRDLYNHLFSIFKARTGGLHHPNPLLNTIQNSFPLAYDISLDAVDHAFGTNRMSEDEVGYISLHIGAAIERCYSSQLKPGKVYLVCGSGMATSRMLEARLKSYFQSKIEILDRFSYQAYMNLPEERLKQADFIVSTVPLPERSIPAVIVDFSLTRDNAESVAKTMSQIQEKRNGTGRFFDEALFVHYPRAVTKEAVLDDLCARLKEAGIAGDDLRGSVAMREQISHTNLNDTFAIPHPMTPAALQTRAAVAILDEPIVWNDQCDSVRIVFLLAFCKGESQDIEHLYDLLLEMVQSASLRHEILEARTFGEFQAAIRSK